VVDLYERSLSAVAAIELFHAVVTLWFMPCMNTTSKKKARLRGRGDRQSLASEANEARCVMRGMRISIDFRVNLGFSPRWQEDKHTECPRILNTGASASFPRWRNCHNA
jgi:hypothetical protein